MRDARLDDLLRSLDVPATPSPEFVSASLEALRPRAQAARRLDATWLGRAWRDLQALRVQMAGRTWRDRPVAVLVLALFLFGLVIVGAVIVGSLQTRGPIRNGILVISVAGELRTYDLEDGATTRLDALGRGNHRVSRSPDGRTIAYWHPAADGATERLFAFDLAGGSPRRLAANLDVSAGGCVDAWSPDSTRLATEVTVGDHSRILVADVRSGVGRLVTDPSFDAACPIWSPDGARIAFHVSKPGGTTAIDVLDLGGAFAQPRIVTGEMRGLEVDGPDIWSSDGRWIYFGAGSGVWRADVEAGKSYLIRPFGLAPIVSPDGTRLSYTVNGDDWELWIANADGTAAHLLLSHARNNGWTADGKFVIARWTPVNAAGGLVRVDPDTGSVTLIAAMADSCPDPDAGCDMGWGMPKP